MRSASSARQVHHKPGQIHALHNFPVLLRRSQTGALQRCVPLPPCRDASRRTVFFMHSQDAATFKQSRLFAEPAPRPGARRAGGNCGSRGRLSAFRKAAFRGDFAFLGASAVGGFHRFPLTFSAFFKASTLRPRTARSARPCAGHKGREPMGGKKWAANNGRQTMGGK